MTALIFFFFFFYEKVNKRTEPAQSLPWLHSASLLHPSHHIPFIAKMSDKANVIAQFYNEEGVASGPPLSLPVDVNPEHLALLLNNLLGNVRGETQKVRVRFHRARYHDHSHTHVSFVLLGRRSSPLYLRDLRDRDCQHTGSGHYPGWKTLDRRDIQDPVPPSGRLQSPCRHPLLFISDRSYRRHSLCLILTLRHHVGQWRRRSDCSYLGSQH